MKGPSSLFLRKEKNTFRCFGFSVCAVLFLVACTTKDVKPPLPVFPIPSEAQLAWHAMETNAFIHFSINTFTGKEWGYGDERPSLFNPTSLNTDQWVTTLKQAGFKTIILTCKHHDGFCLWQSDLTEHSVKNSPYKNGNGDVVKELYQSVQREGLKFGIYVSPWDRNRGDYGQPSYITFYRKQLAEIFQENRNITEMWFDGANGGDGYYGGKRERRVIDKTTYYDWPATIAQVREKQPAIIFFSDAGPDVRWAGNERGEAGETNWNMISTDTLYAGKEGIESLLNTGNEQGAKWVPAEVDVSIRPGWFFHEQENSLVKTPQQLLDIYLSSVGRGSTLLLNVPPDKRGLIHEADIKALQGWRKLLDETFKNNLAAGAKVEADSYRGNSAHFGPANVTDANKDSYWTTDDNVKKGSLEIELSGKPTINYILLQEYIRLGQRVENFTVDAYVGDTWKKIAEGTTIGYKRILRIPRIQTGKIRILISAARACPLISNVEIF